MLSNLRSSVYECLLSGFVACGYQIPSYPDTKITKIFLHNLGLFGLIFFILGDIKIFF